MDPAGVADIALLGSAQGVNIDLQNLAKRALQILLDLGTRIPPRLIALPESGQDGLGWPAIWSTIRRIARVAHLDRLFALGLGGPQIVGLLAIEDQLVDVPYTIFTVPAMVFDSVAGWMGNQVLGGKIESEEASAV